MQLTQDYIHDISPRFRWLYVVVTGFAVLLLLRLFYLQIIRGSEYRQFSQAYSIRDIAILAPRGLILDRNGKILASNQPTLDLVMIPQYVQDWEKLRASLVQVLGVSAEALDGVWEKRKGKAAYQPITVATALSLDTVSRIKSHKTPWYFMDDPFDLRGVEIVPRGARRYKDGALAPHLLGYLQEDTVGNMEGAAGIEHHYDALLQGKKGRHERVVNAMGRVVDYPSVEARLERHDPIPGATLQTGIDERLQVAARNGFGKRTGALVALDPRTGAVLALYSSPGYDLTRMGEAGRGNYWQQMMDDARRPVYNRTVQGAYPPGSTYKMVTALAGLSEKVITADETVTCRGGLEIGGRRFGCWNKGGHGAVSMVRALTESCDVYFYTIGLRLGLDRLAAYARKLGLGTKTGIDLPQERSGLIPTNAWKQARFGREGTAGDVAMAAIGQGFDLLTPLQDALMVARLVNGGVMVTPHVVKKMETPSDSLSFDPAHLTLIRKGMEGVVNAPGGTARHLALRNLKIAGKTGTAQTVGYDSKVKKGDHAWFVGYAPYDDPQIVVAAIVEYAGHGGTAAAPIVGDVIAAFFKDTRHASTR